MEMVSEKLGLDMQQLKDEYFTNGFLKLPGFFSKEKIEQVRLDAKYIFVSKLQQMKLIGNDFTSGEFDQAMFKFFKNDIKSFSNCGKQAQHLISLHQISLDKRLIDLLQELGLHFPIISTRPVMFFNSRFLALKESYWKTPPHQDWRSIQGSVNSMVVWVPLIDIDKQLGAIEIIPQSHLEGLVCEDTVDSFGLVTEEFQKDEHFISVEVEQGDIVVFSQFMIHRSGNNITDSIRWSCHFRYNDLDEPSFVERGFPHTYIYKPDDTLINPDFPTKELVNNYFKL